MNRKIDHIVYAVPDLAIAMKWFEDKTSVRPVIGGQHKAQGTQNALLNLGNGCYLEILAIDGANTQIKSPRWMGIDLIEVPKITRWCIKSSDLEDDAMKLKKYNSSMGVIQAGQRQLTNGKLLSWEMIMPLSEQEVEIIPFMTDWQKSDFHPTSKLPKHCKLLKMGFSHPSPEKIIPILDDLLIEVDVVKGKKAAIWAEIKTPKGIIRI